MKQIYLPSEIMEMAAAERMATPECADLSVELVAAICMAESSGQAWAVRYEPDFGYVDLRAEGRPDDCPDETERCLQKISWGLMQIMGATAREVGFRGWLTELLVPEVNLHYGICYLLRLKKRWPKTQDQIAAYNAGSPRRLSNGWYVNQRYVSRVIGFMAEFNRSAANAEERHHG